MSTVTGIRRTYPVEVDIPAGTIVQPDGMASGDPSDYSPDMHEAFELVKRAVVECSGTHGQLVTFTGKMRMLYGD